jgi:eukaryotic-like serine/threonine-protein kinase
MDDTSRPDYEFEGYRLDTVMQVLVSPEGATVPLPSRAFAALRCLVERAGELVDKSALMATVWPRTVVAENNLNQCILALRKALGESAGERRFILTVPGRGYKFVAPVRVLPRSAARAAAPSARTRGPRRWWVAAGICAVVLVAGAVPWLMRRHPVTSPAEYEQLTDVTDSATAPVLSPDGRMLAFIRNGSWLLGSGQIWLKVLPNGEPVKLTRAEGPLFAPAFTPDGTRIAYSVADERLSSWDTWTVPVTGGGVASKLLPNASGLTYIGTHEVMYSQFKRGIHLGIAASTEDRSRSRDIYLPSHERGMAHFSYLSPDRRSVLVVEMGPTGVFGRCRLVSFDGRTRGYAVGPEGSCIGAAWSPGGEAMYFSVNIDGHTHLWRQFFPRGEPQQITFGPTDEVTVSVAPDGHSLLTSLGVGQTNLWLHDANGTRVLTTQGHPSSPWLSPDARRVFFRSVGIAMTAHELSSLDVATGEQQVVLPDFDIMDFDISPDLQQVVFSTVRDGSSQVWLAPLDRRAAPTLLARGGDQVAFGGGRVFFRSIGAHANYLHRIDVDGSNEIAVLKDPITNFWAVAPDGRCVSLDSPFNGGMPVSWLIPVDHPAARVRVGNGFLPSRWSHDGRTLYVDYAIKGDAGSPAQTAALPIGADDLPAKQGDVLPVSPGTVMIPLVEDSPAVGPDPSTYAFLKSEQRWNIYRIPLH